MFINRKVELEILGDMAARISAIGGGRIEAILTEMAVSMFAVTADGAHKTSLADICVRPVTRQSTLVMMCSFS
jgi:hypothetical protein